MAWKINWAFIFVVINDAIDGCVLVCPVAAVFRQKGECLLIDAPYSIGSSIIHVRQKDRQQKYNSKKIIYIANILF
jgi:hypothetical protein